MRCAEHALQKLFSEQQWTEIVTEASFKRMYIDEADGQVKIENTGQTLNESSIPLTVDANFGSNLREKGQTSILSPNRETFNKTDLSEGNKTADLPNTEIANGIHKKPIIQIDQKVENL